MRFPTARVFAGLSLFAAATATCAADLRVQCYSDGNEGEVLPTSKRFEAEIPVIKVVVDQMPYKAIDEPLPVQLASGQGPDIARITDLGGLTRSTSICRPI